MKKLLLIILVIGLAISSCQTQKKESTSMENPFFKEWTTPFSVPPFDEIKVEHYLPAAKEAIKQHQAEIDAIVANSEEPTFENTILVYDKSGELFDKVSGVFGPLSSAVTNDEMQAVARELYPMATKHYDNILMNPELFEKIKAVYNKRNELNFDEEQMRTVEKYYEDFERNGANLSDSDKEI